MKRIAAETSPHDPGTPDLDVSRERLEGRIAFRIGDGECPYLHGQPRIDWFLGYYDGRLRRFYER